MSPQTVGIVGFLIMVALIFLRMPVAIALGLVGTVGYAVLNGWTQSLLVLSRVPLTFASAYDLSVVPLFVLMGVDRRPFRHGARIVPIDQRHVQRPARHAGNRDHRRLRGARRGLRILGGDGGDHESRRSTGNASRRLRRAAGARLGGGRWHARHSNPALGDADLLRADRGAIDSAIVRGRHDPGTSAGGAADRRHQDRDLDRASLGAGIARARRWRERLRASLGMWKLLFIFLLSIGGIYAGWFSPTEAAAVGTFATIVIAALTRQLTPSAS